MVKSDEQDVKPEAQEEKKPTTEQVQGENESTAKKQTQSTSKEQENERLKGQISALQKKVDEESAKFQKLTQAFVTEEGEKALQPEDVLQEVNNLKAEIKLKNLELEKNSYIDSLEISEARKKTLKSLVKSENYQEEVEKINSSFDEVYTFENQRLQDKRPRSEGSISQSDFSVNDILENPDKFKRAKGLL
jgi:hypothetical protein